MVGFSIGLTIGCYIGIAIMCLMIVASRADDEASAKHKQNQKETDNENQT